MDSLIKRVKRYRRRYGLLKKAGQVGASVRRHKTEYGLLVRGVKDYLTHRGKTARRNRTWHR